MISERLGPNTLGQQNLPPELMGLHVDSGTHSYFRQFLVQAVLQFLVSPLQNTEVPGKTGICEQLGLLPVCPVCTYHLQSTEGIKCLDDCLISHIFLLNFWLAHSTSGIKTSCPNSLVFGIVAYYWHLCWGWDCPTTAPNQVTFLLQLSCYSPCALPC